MVGNLVESNYFLGFRGIVVGKVPFEAPVSTLCPGSTGQLDLYDHRIRWKILWFQSPFGPPFIEVLASKDFKRAKQ